MCGSTKNTDKAVADQTAWTTSMKSEATQVFGTDTRIVNDLVNTAESIWNAGPSQQGWSAAQTNAVNSQIVNNAAVSNRNIQSAAGNAASATNGRFGTGASGLTPGVTAGIAENVEAQKSSALNQATVQNWTQGNENWKVAGQTLQNAPSVYNNMDSFNKNAQSGLDRNMANAQAADAASNWWVKPVTGLVSGAIGLGMAGATGGMSSMIPGMGGSSSGGGTGAGWGAGGSATATNSSPLAGGGAALLGLI